MDVFLLNFKIYSHRGRGSGWVLIMGGGILKQLYVEHALFTRVIYCRSSCVVHEQFNTF